MQQSGRALAAASPLLQADLKIVVAAVTQDRRALQHAARELQSNPLVTQAAKHSRSSIQARRVRGTRRFGTPVSH